MARGVNIATLTARLAADTSDFSRKMKSAERDLSSFAAGAKQIGSSAKAVGRTMTTRLTAPILGVGAAAVTAAANFESSMNRVGALTQTTGATFESMNQQAKDLGRETMFSAGAAADGMAFLAQAGFKANEITSAMPGMLDLAAAGQLELAEAADIASNVLTGFNMSAGEANRVSDLLAATSIKTNTNVQQLGHAMKFVAPVAASAGFEIEEMAAGIGLLGNAGIQGSMAGTTLRNVIVKLLKPTSEAASVIDRLGLNVQDSEGNLVSLTSIVQQLEEAGASTADMMTIFGVRGGPGLAALVAQGSDALADMNTQLENAGGTAGEVAERQMEGLKGQILLFKSSLEAVAIAIGDTGLLGFLTDLVGQGEKVVKWMAGLDETTLKIVTSIAGLVALAGPVLWMLGSMVTNISALVTAASAASITVGGLATVLGGVAAIGLVGAGIGALADKFINLELPVLDAQRALELFYETGRENADFTTLMGGDIDNLSEEMLNLKGITAGTLDVLGQWGANFVSLLPFAEVEGPMDQAVERFEILDQAISNIADSGDMGQVAFWLSRVADEAAEADIPLDELAGLLPTLMNNLDLSEDELSAFVDALSKGYDPTVALANAQGELMVPLDDVTSAAERQEAAFGNVTGEMDPFATMTEEAAGSQADLNTAVEETTASMQEQFDLLRAQVDPVFALFKAEEELTAAQEKVNQMQEEGNTTGREYEQALQDLVEATLGFGEAGAAATTGGLAQLDSMLDTLVEDERMTRQEADLLLAALQRVDRDGDVTANLFVNFDASGLNEFERRMSELIGRRWEIPMETQIALELPGGGGTRGTPERTTSFNPALPPEYRADGGTVLGGRPYITGERGPEVFVPGRTGTIVPNEEAFGGGGQQINVTIDARGMKGDVNDAERLSTELREVLMMQAVR